MNRFALIAATGFLALALTACGEQGNKQPAGANNNAATTQPAPSQPAGQGQNQTQNPNQ